MGKLKSLKRTMSMMDGDGSNGLNSIHLDSVHLNDGSSSMMMMNSRSGSMMRNEEERGFGDGVLFWSLQSVRNGSVSSNF